MTFELQYVLSLGICIFLLVCAWYRILEMESDNLGRAVACEYCSYVAVTTCFESDIERDVAVCQNHTNQF